MLDWLNKAYQRPQVYASGKAKSRWTDPAVVKLSSNENPYGPSPRALRAARDALAGTHLYPDSDGAELRAKLAEHVGLAAENVLLGNGSNELLALVARVCLQVGDELLVVRPSFVAYGMAAAWAGASVREVVLCGDDSDDVDRLLGEVKPATKMVFLANPNNPTGSYLNADAMLRLVRTMLAHVVLVIDEAYFEYVAATDHLAATQLLEHRERMLVLRTFSKMHGLAGLRLGYGIGASEFVNCLHHARMPFSINCVAQAAAVAALEDHGHAAYCKAQNRAQMEFLGSALKRLGLSYLPSQANFLLVKFPQHASTINGQLERKGILIRAMDAYGLPAWQRISVGNAAQNRQLIDALNALIAVP